MKIVKYRILDFPFYPWLISIFPIIHLYSENITLVHKQEALLVLASMLAAATIAFSALNHLLRNKSKSALMLSVCSIFFALSGHVYAQLSLPISQLHWTILAVLAIFFCPLLLHYLIPNHFYRQVLASSNLIALALLILPTYRIIAYHFSTKPVMLDPLERGSAVAAKTASPKVNDSVSHPDIYYIIPDGYPSDSWLQEAMNYENSAFTNALEARGFHVIDHAQSNYGSTLLSLASILNMEYFTDNATQYHDLDYLRLAIADSKVARQILSYGYTYVQFLSGYLLPSPVADINRDFSPNGPLNLIVDQDDYSVAIQQDGKPIDWHASNLSYFYKQSFISLYLQTTILSILESDIMALLPRNNAAPYELFSQDRFLDTIKEIETIVGMPEATFTIVHLLKPHGPVSFDESGNSIEMTWKASHDQYFAEFEFVNSIFIQMIDMILQGSQTPPIILFQADHASTYGKVLARGKRLTHFDVYAAYYLPDTPAMEFPRPYTLVNAFPLLLNAAFEATYEQLDDRLFDMPKGYDAPFEQRDVTEAFIKQKMK